MSDHGIPHTLKLSLNREINWRNLIYIQNNNMVKLIFLMHEVNILNIIAFIDEMEKYNTKIVYIDLSEIVFTEYLIDESTEPAFKKFMYEKTNFGIDNISTLKKKEAA